MKYRDTDTLIDIFNAARAAIEFKGTMSKGVFLDDHKTQSAVLHQLLIVGEAVKRLSKEFLALHPSIPWREIARMRDKLIHHYEGVDLEEIWKTLTRDLPQLLGYLQPLLPPLPPKEEA